MDVELLRIGATALVGLGGALLGLAGVALGGYIAAEGQKIQRRQARASEQLERFYAPLLGLYMAIDSKSEVRRQIVDALGPEGLDDLGPFLEAGNQQLREELLPLYQQMVRHFTDNMMYAEPSTRAHYLDLVRFVDIWDFHLKVNFAIGTLSRLGHDEQALRSLYQDLISQHDRLVEALKT